MTEFLEVGRHKVLVSKRKGQRTIRLRVNTQGTAVLSMPKRYPKYLGATYLKTKLSWLDKHTFAINQIKDGSMLFTNQLVKVDSDSALRNSTKVEPGLVTFKLKQSVADPASQKYITTKVKKLYSDELTKVIEQRLNYFCDITGLKYSSFTVKSHHSKWGSCDRHRQLQFSLYLLGCTQELIDYVVLHELAHTEHMHHQKEFWALCETYMPDYVVRRKQLKKAKMLLI